MMSDVLIEVLHLVKTSKNRRILDDISMSLERNMVHCIVGENGAGKSTLFNALIGLEDIDSGLCKVMGHNSYALPVKVRAKIGYISADHALPNHLTIKQLIDFQMASFNHWSRDVFDQITSGISVDLAQKSAQLSRGENLIVYLALILAQRPQLLILDEPTNGLDVHSQQLLFDALLMNDHFENSTVLISTHQVSEIERFADNVVVLHQGKLVSSGTPQAIINSVKIWRFTTQNLAKITQAIAPVLAIQQIDESIYLTTPASACITKEQLTELGAVDVERVPSNLSKAISALTQKAHSLLSLHKEGKHE